MPKRTRYTPGQVRKAIVGAVGFVVTTATVALEGELIPEQAVPYVVAVIGIAASYGIFRARNDAPYDADGVDGRHELK